MSNSKKPKKICSVEGCERVHSARGYCSLHYGRVYRNGTPGEIESRIFSLREAGLTECRVDGCNGPLYSKGFCQKHYRRNRIEGSPGEVESRSRSKYTPDQTCEIESCSNSIKAKGLCSRHYQRKRKYGTTDISFTQPRNQHRKRTSIDDLTEICAYEEINTHTSIEELNPFS